MNVTVISRKVNLRGGGSNFSLHAVANQLSNRGHTVTLVTANSELNWLPDEPDYELVERNVIDDENKAATARAVYGLLTEYESSSDVYHVFNPRYAAVGGWYRSRGGAVPVVSRLNTYIFCTNRAAMDGECHRNCTVRAKFRHDRTDTRNKVTSIPIYAARTFAEPGLLSELDRLFAISPTVKDVYRFVGVDQDRIEVVPNFFDPEFATDDGAGSADTSDDDQFGLLYVGRLEEFKGVDTLLKALLAVPESVRLDVIGDGPAADAFESDARSLGLDERVTFHGWVDHAELPPYYRSADAFVHPGKWPEPFGRTLLEAMQCETPVVVSDVGAPPWVAGDAGVTFERDDSRDLARTVSSLVDDTTRLERMERACGDRLQDFRPSAVIDEMVGQYRSIVEN